MGIEAQRLWNTHARACRPISLGTERCLVNQGPLIDAQAIAKVEAHVADAVAKGAKVVVGGTRIGERFYTPTVLADVTPQMVCAREETFGPVAPVFRF